MFRKIESVDDVVEWQLCTGCGACAYAEPNRFEMKDAPDVGFRPALKANAEAETGAGLAACPGAVLERPPFQTHGEMDQNLYQDWGPVLGVWEGYAIDEDIRWAGSSGGAATALSAFALANGKAGQVLHVGAHDTDPSRNQTRISKNRDELLKNAGSRYAPSGPCESLDVIEQSDARGVIVGKPCDIAASRKAALQNPSLEDKIAIRIAFFCAGTPSTNGNLSLLAKQGFKADTELQSLKFRGQGWPGLWRATGKHKDGSTATAEMTYADSWGYLQQFRQWRCYICPDHTGEFADIAVGDPWYRPIEPGESGKSLLVARTREGLEFLLEAEKAGFIKLETRDNSLLPRSQPNIYGARANLWGRLFAMALTGAAPAKFPGFMLFRSWISGLGIIDKVKSVASTARRVFRKKLNMRMKPEFPKVPDHSQK